jgi:hypothetical protein
MISSCEGIDREGHVVMIVGAAHEAALWRGMPAIRMAKADRTRRDASFY